jgi:antagonist of KipI
MPHFTVIRPGMLTTVQDLGRWGYQHSGVPVAGPMDAYSHRLANRLVGNPDGAAGLEITLLGPVLEAHGDIVCAVAGAEFELTVGERPGAMHRAITVAPGERLRFGGRTAGARATLAVRGGFDLPATFGSRATSVLSRMGPFGGRALLAGDELPVGSTSAPGQRGAAGAPLGLPAGGARLRVVPGPHDTMFTSEALDSLRRDRFVVTPQSNRMGYRLEGPRLVHRGSADILSDATPIGSLQVPASGQVILLMADRQTTGGYPRIATVISADLSIAGQLAPGDWIAFEPCTRDEGVQALEEQEARLAGSRS